jgi:HD-GYP domain-containing protein (c-di-GMP phosphodiesterase class II)
MVRVRDDILRKAGALSDSEVNSIRSHSERGLEILEPVENSEEVRDAILFHHERFDGKGYPSGLAGERIPLFARIIAVVDAYESMVQDRPHRQALSEDSATQELRKNSGSQFDPNVVNALLETAGEEPA